MPVRANWKGTLKIADLTCAVALSAAASTSDRIAFHTLNRKTGHRVHRKYFDVDTDEPVEADDQVKGFEVSPGQTVLLSPEEIAAAIPESDKILDVTAFVALADVDDLYFDKPYYLTPATPVAADAFNLIREGLHSRQVAAIARTVIFRRVRSLLIRQYGDGLVAETLDFDYEIRSPNEAFSDISKIKIDPEMLDLALHIIKTKSGPFDPSAFDDRYENALAELVKAKIEGRKMRASPRPKPTKTGDLMDALRQSAGVGIKPAKPGSIRQRARKAG